MELNVIIVGNDSERSLLKIKSIEKLEIIAIFQKSKEVQDIVYVILCAQRNSSGFSQRDKL